MGTNCFYNVLRDLNGPSKQTVCRAVRSVAEALYDHRAEFITWPEDTSKLARDFYALAGFPAVAGALDSTHVLITPPKDDEVSFVNRHHTHSLNVLGVAGPDHQFLYVNANFGGRSHDSRVLRSSSLWARFEDRGDLPFDGAVLLGDSAYPLRSWLMTPFLGNPDDDAKKRFNRSHSRTRTIVEQAFGILKQRFYCLRTGLRVKDITLASKIVVACIILHNLSIQHGGELPELDEPEDQEEAENVDFQGRNDGSGDIRRVRLLVHFQR